MNEKEIRQAFKNNSDCYADTGVNLEDGSHIEGDVEQAMTEDGCVKLIQMVLDNQWVKTSIRLPDNNEEILIWSEEESAKLKERTIMKLSPMHVFYNNGFKVFHGKWAQQYLNNINVSHWKPLPKPLIK